MNLYAPLDSTDSIATLGFKVQTAVACASHANDTNQRSNELFSANDTFLVFSCHAADAWLTAGRYISIFSLAYAVLLTVSKYRTTRDKPKQSYPAPCLTLSQ